MISNPIPILGHPFKVNQQMVCGLSSRTFSRMIQPLVSILSSPTMFHKYPINQVGISNAVIMEWYLGSHEEECRRFTMIFHEDYLAVQRLGLTCRPNKRQSRYVGLLCQDLAYYLVPLMGRILTGDYISILRLHLHTSVINRPSEKQARVRYECTFKNSGTKCIRKWGRLKYR